MAEPGLSDNSRLVGEIWSGFRPYLKIIAVDFLVTVSLWVVLFSFKWLTVLLAIDGWAGNFIVNLHAAGAVGAFGIFALLLAIDIYALHQHGKGKSDK